MFELPHQHLVTPERPTSATFRLPRRMTALAAVALLAVTAALASGCKKSEPAADASTTAQAPKLLDDSAVLKAFSSAPPAVRYTIEQPVNAAQAGGFADALPQLQKIAASPQLTPEQRTAVNEFIQQIQAHMSGR